MHFPTPCGEEEREQRRINYLLFETSYNWIPFNFFCHASCGNPASPQSIQRRTTSRGKHFTWIKHSITGRGRVNNLSSRNTCDHKNNVIWIEVEVYHVLNWAFQCSKYICQNYFVWQCLMDWRKISVRFWFSGHLYVLWKLLWCGQSDSRSLHVQPLSIIWCLWPKNLFQHIYKIIKTVKKSTSKIKTTLLMCDLGLSKQSLLTNLIWHFECLGLFCEWEFNHHIINGFGVGPVIHDTVLYSLARNLCAEMNKVVDIFYGAISWPEGAFD